SRRNDVPNRRHARARVCARRDGAAGRGRDRLMRRTLLLLVAVSLAVAAPATAFTPTNPLAPRQWYLQDDHAFDAWPTAPPTNLQPVKVAIVDSGVDCTLPDFAGRLLAEKTFVGGNPCVD